MAAITKELVTEIAPRVSSNLSQKFTKSYLYWFGDLQKETKLPILSQILSQRLYIHLDTEY